MKVMKKVLVMLLITMMMINVIPVHAVTYNVYKKGDKIKVKVNDTSSLEFYVIEDKGKNSNSLKAIYGGIFNGKFNYEGAKKYLVDLKETWKNSSSIDLPKMEEIFGDDVELKSTFPYDLPTWSFSDSRYWTANKIAWASGYKTLGAKILEDNTEYADNVRSEFVDSDTGIDFSKNSFGKAIIVGGHDGVYVPKNGKGLYYTSKNTEDNKKTYYFRGAVTNNYVKFAGYYWKIMRINEDGSIRLIFNGKGELDTNKQEELYPIQDKNVVLDLIRPYNSLQPGYTNYVGYMFNQRIDPPTIAEMHTNERDSDIKEYLDEWYSKNLETYDKFISGEAGFCNDRTYVRSETLGMAGFSTVERAKAHVPTYKCQYDARDLFTTDTVMRGNRELTKPIGLPTVDDLMYAGGVYGQSDQYSYLYSSNYFWTMSPGEFVSGPGSSSNMFVGSFGGITAVQTYLYTIQNSSTTTPNNGNYAYSNVSKNVRPVINLKASVEVAQGDGTHDNPYIINTSNKIGSDVVWTLGGTGTGTAQTMDVSETLAIKPVITISKEYVTALDNGDTTPDDGDDGQGGTTVPGDDGDDDGQGGTTDPGDDGNGDQGDGGDDGDDGQGGDNNPGDDEPKNPSTGDNLLVIIGSTIILGGLAVYAYKRRKVNI